MKVLDKIITETINEVLNQLDLKQVFNDPLLQYNDKFFSIQLLKITNWKNGEEIIRYCEKCNLYKVGEGVGRVVFQIDDNHVIKIQKSNSTTAKQNEKEVNAFRICDNKMREFVPYIFDYDKNHLYPLWIISEQVLPATYADFQKILGFDFGSYQSKNDIDQMQQDLKDFSEYHGKTVNKFSFNLMDFLDAYGDDDIEIYQSIIDKNEWLQELIKLLDNGIVSYWELEIISNWGLVIRNGKPKLIVLDIGL